MLTSPDPQNPGWGSPKEASVGFSMSFTKSTLIRSPLQRKVTEYYATDRLDGALPIPDALDGVKRLKGMGFKLVVVTARPHDVRERSLLWVDRHFPGMHDHSSQKQVTTMRCPPGLFESVICTGQSQEGIFAHGHELVTKTTKADVRTR